MPRQGRAGPPGKRAPKAKAKAPRGASEASGPRRTCVACRGEADRDELIRLVSDPDGQVVLDLRNKLPGRGAWVHPTRACVAALERDPRGVARALGLTGAAGSGSSREGKGRLALPGLEQQLQEGLLRLVLDGLSLAQAGGALVSGHDALESAIAQGRIAEIAIASDASERTIRSLVGERGDLEVTRLPIESEALGAQIGLAPRAAVGLVRSGAFKHLRSQLRRLRCMG